MTTIRKIMHAIKIACSVKYATNFEVVRLLAQLASLIAGCAHSKAPMEEIKVLTNRVQQLDPQRMSEAIQLLSAANNFDCMAYAIVLDPQQGKFCADKLMMTARENLKLCGHGDRATWSRKQLILARKWYRIAGMLSESLCQEINAGLDKTKWVLAMWPRYQEIIDPEGH